jgi:hypothetical protein
VSPRQVRGRLRRAVAWSARAISSARRSIAVAAVALAIAALAWEVATGSGLLGAAAPAAVAPEKAASTPAERAASPPGFNSTTGPQPSPHVRLAAGTATTRHTGSTIGAQPSAATQASATAHPSSAAHKEDHKRRPTTTTLAASPNPATVGGKVTLTATERISGGGHPAGHVQFEVGDADIGSPVEVDAGGVAAMTTTFSAPGKQSLSAEFTPTSASYAGSKGTFSLVVRPVPANVAGIETISVTVPRTGAFTVTIQPGPVQLTPSGATATGRLPRVTVTDTRNWRPGWSLSGQASRFTYSRTGRSVSGNQLGWVPTVVGSLHDGAKLGRKVNPARPGIGSAPATLAFAPAGCGSGTNIFSANLTLEIPRAVGGRYTGTVTITYVESQPAPTDDDHGVCGGSPSRPPGGDR